ncbi:MAG: Chemotaxis regulator - transmits chemoreceptor signals to flagelllar motor components CheY [uncultured Paraburkholderia sp.]|nr:MAG: Chemotaxis regulator - transmits chemoreceptor signals to flagelllar motor components CheY [uncultured Paraburkholderia sp.]
MNSNIAAAQTGGKQHQQQNQHKQQGDTLAEADGLTGFLEQQQKMMNGALRLDRATIVLVEDDPDSRESLTLLLEAEGANVVAVADAEEGVEAAVRLLPDAVVCDLELPAMDGFYLIQRLRDHEIRGDHAPSVAVALTGHTDDAYRLRSIGEGFQHFMTKPALPEDLVNLLHHALSAHARRVECAGVVPHYGAAPRDAA